MKKLVKILKWAAISVLAAFVLLVIVRIGYHFAVNRNTERVAQIRSTKITMDDVMGKNLPSDPEAESDKTIAGIDANNNGIRDDVELAIFKEYSNSAKTRAVLLQYAQVLQTEMTQPALNAATVSAAVGNEDSAFFCVASIVPGDDKQANMPIIQNYIKFVTDKQLNTPERKKARDDFYANLKSGSIQNTGCDVDITALSD